MQTTSPSTKFTPLTPLQMQVVQSLTSGSSVSAAAEQAGLHRSTIYLWTRSIPGFNQILSSLRQQRASRMIDEIGDLADLAIDTFRHILTDTSAPAAARLKAALEIVKIVDAQRAPADTTLTTEEPAEEPAPAPAERTQSPASQFPASQFPASQFPASQFPASQAATVGRNSPCPCGSSLKYKRCCGDPLLRRQLTPAAATHAPQITANRPESGRSPAPEMALPAPPH